ncbi:hypothetical protein [Microbacterium alcoholitolerans]|uniref:hypothetical protein n=1 Tax=unclassified Microbacterium TaxID=2609290 RepID=UPI003D16ADE5
MNTSIATALGRDETENARQLVEIGLAMDREARSETLARLIAASLHGGPGSTLEHFAATGELSPQAALVELNELQVPLEQEGWVDALGRFILATAGGRS